MRCRCKEAVTCADEYSIGIKYDARGRAAKADFEFDRVFPSSGEGSSQVRTSSAVGGCGDSGNSGSGGRDSGGRDSDSERDSDSDGERHIYHNQSK